MIINPIFQVIAALRKQIQKARAQSNFALKEPRSNNAGPASEKIKKSDLKQVEKK